MNTILLVVLIISILWVLWFYDFTKKIDKWNLKNDWKYEDIINLYNEYWILTCLVSWNYFTYERKNQEFLTKFYLSWDLFYKEFTIPENWYKSYALQKNGINYKWGDEYMENEWEYWIYDYSTLELLINGISTYKLLDDNLSYKCSIWINWNVDFQLPEDIKFSGSNWIIWNEKVDTDIINRYLTIPSIDTSSWKTYNNWTISFKYPSNLVVSNKEFETFGFNDSSNIHVYTYTFSQIFDKIIDNDLYRALMENKDIDTIKYSKEQTQHYKEILQDIKDWKWVKSVSSKDFFDHFSSWRTEWAISAFPITINWINWLVVNYYFTQDSTAGCLSQFNTELMVVKDENTIISIMFKNNFWWVKNLLNKYNGGSEVCIWNDWDYKIAEDASNYIEKYYEYGESLEWTKYQVFADNDELITKIIYTFQLLK